MIFWRSQRWLNSLTSLCTWAWSLRTSSWFPVLGAVTPVFLNGSVASTSMANAQSVSAVTDEFMGGSSPASTTCSWVICWGLGCARPLVVTVAWLPFFRAPVTRLAAFTFSGVFDVPCFAVPPACGLQLGGILHIGSCGLSFDLLVKEGTGKTKDCKYDEQYTVSQRCNQPYTIPCSNTVMLVTLCHTQLVNPLWQKFVDISCSILCGHGPLVWCHSRMGTPQMWV